MWLDVIAGKVTECITIQLISVNIPGKIKNSVHGMDCKGKNTTSDQKQFDIYHHERGLKYK